MGYSINIEEFNRYFISGDSFKHNSGNFFRLFPFVTSPNVEYSEIDKIMGQALCQMQGIEPVLKDEDTIVSEIKAETDVEADCEEDFEKVIKQLFFDEHGNIRPLNLTMIEQIACTGANEKKLAEYIADVLGDMDVLNESIAKSKEKLLSGSNVLEKLLYSKFTTQPVQSTNRKKYFRVVDGLHEIFEDDFKYILSSDSRTREYLLLLFEFYYFIYTSQTMLQLSKKLDGSREIRVPLFFSLEWEPTKIHGKYISDGWNYLQEVIHETYTHAVVLEMLNVNETNDAQMDYIAIKDYIDANPQFEDELKSRIDEISEIYKYAIKDCKQLEEIILEDNHDLEDSIEHLFRLVKTQFDNTSRGAAEGRYNDKFEDYCSKFLKNRGRNGYVLNISEELLIFLTVITIKDKDKMKLSDVFKEFEMRGVFLEKDVREQVAAYYEKLNLIEKKSDSGDAKYVKRIL